MATAPLFDDVQVLHYRVAHCTLDEAAAWTLAAVKEPNPKLLVTLNPEIIVQAESRPELKHAIQAATVRVADGVGVVWAAKQFGNPVPERIPGVELMTHILALGGDALRVFFLGAKPDVAAKAAQEASKRYQTQVAGVHHGYFKPEEIPHITQLIKESRAQLLLAGLGEGQELFLHQHQQDFCVPVMIGVGGALDVLSGEVKRTPLWTRQVGLEWAWRVGFDRKRWHRLPRLAQFVKLVMRAS